MALKNWADIWGEIWADIWAVEGEVVTTPTSSIRVISMAHTIDVVSLSARVISVASTA